MKIQLPNTFLGVNTAEALERVLKDETKTPITPKTPINTKNLDGYILVPSIGLYVAKERTLENHNWFDAHKELKKQNERMLTLYEFAEFLKHAKTNAPDIYEDITAVRDPARGEWIDADFKYLDKNGSPIGSNEKGDLWIYYNHILDAAGNLVSRNKEKLENCIMEDCKIGLLSYNKQGMPTKKGNDVNYWFPRKDNNSVARFVADSGGAYLDCDWVPQSSVGWLGVRRAREK